VNIGSGYNTNTLVLGSAILKGDTRDANNCGFYKFYCIATDNVGQTLRSEIAEVAVGCGAKNKDGDWLSFMCFNLGADVNSTISSQKTAAVSGVANQQNVYGSMFQWGRIADGHELRANAGVAFGSLTAASDIVTGKKCPGETINGNPYMQIKKGTQWYGHFIYNIPAIDKNWNPIPQVTADGISIPANDPCVHYNVDGTYVEFWNESASDGQNPGNGVCERASTRWRIPSQEEWGSLYQIGSAGGPPDDAVANTWVWHATGGKGFEIRPDNVTATLFLPATGYRSYNSGNSAEEGLMGAYWSGSIGGSNASNTIISSTTVTPGSSGIRSFGYAIRCIKNISPRWA
jgi:uncharacterized protein (TIGR02145 family)